MQRYANLIDTPRTVKLANAVLVTGATAAVEALGDGHSIQATLSNTTTPTATVQPEGSNDLVAWVAIGSPMVLSGALNSAAVKDTVGFAYHRANITAISGVSAAVTVTRSN